MDTIDIRPVKPSDLAEWRALYDGYAAFYKREMTDAIAANVWSWLHDPAHEMEGLVACQNGQPVGLAHFRRMPSPLRGADIGFLDDMFIVPEARGHGIAPKMFETLSGIAKERGWEIVRWITADDNYRARTLYDRVAKKAGWNVYEMKP